MPGADLEILEGLKLIADSAMLDEAGRRQNERHGS